MLQMWKISNACQSRVPSQRANLLKLWQKGPFPSEMQICQGETCPSYQEKGESAFLEAVTENGNEDPWVVELSLKGRPVTFNIDTGAEVMVVTEKTWRETGQPKLECPKRMLQSPDSHVICTLGKFIGSFEIGAHQT